MNKLGAFKIGVMVICGVATLVAFLLFSTYKGTSGSAAVSGTVTVWGSFRPEEIEPLLNGVRQTYPDLKVYFQNKNANTMYTDFVSSAATNQSPEILIVPISNVLSYAPFITPISKTSLSDRVIGEQFIDAVTPLNTPLGMIGVPVSINPLLLVANKEYLQSIFVTNLPGTWNDLAALTEQLAKSENTTITQPVIPLGTISENHDAYGALISMMMQARSNVVLSTTTSSSTVTSTDILIQYKSDIESTSTILYSSLGSAFEYFSAYSKPGTNVFSWNEELGNPITMFKTKRLPMMIISYQSLLSNFSLDEINNLSISLVPLTSNDITSKPISYADGYVAIIPKLTRNIPGSYATAFSLISADVQNIIPSSLKQYPVLSSLSTTQKDNYLDELVRKSAVQSRVVPFNGKSNLISLLSKSLTSFTSGRLDKESALIEFSNAVSSSLIKLLLK